MFIGRSERIHGYSNPVMSPDWPDYIASAGNQMTDAMMRDCPYVHPRHTSLRIADLPTRLANPKPPLRNSLFRNAYSNIRWGFMPAALSVDIQWFGAQGGLEPQSLRNAKSLNNADLVDD